MQIAVEYDLILHQMDVNAPIDYDIYIEQPEGYEQLCNLKLKIGTYCYINF